MLRGTAKFKVVLGREVTALSQFRKSDVTCFELRRGGLHEKDDNVID